MKKFLSVTLVMMMLFSFASIGSFADDGCTTYPYITMDSSDDFTHVMNANNTATIKVVGLSSSFVKTDFTPTEKQYLTWKTSDNTVAKFKIGALEYNKISGYDDVRVVAKGEGRATITITYDTPDDEPVSVTSTIVVEGTGATPSVSLVDIAVNGVNIGDFTMDDVTVPLFSLKAIYGTSYDDADVLKKQPTALHGLLYALECQYDLDGTTDINNANWDWDWVSANVTITSQGSYVSAISTDVNSGTTGWQYTINSVSSNYASSIEPLSTSDNLGWAFEDYSW